MAGENNSKLETLQKKSEEQANTIARLENDIKKLGDSNSSPRIIQRGNQLHPKYEKNTIKVAATLPKAPEKPTKKSSKK
jgi:hypothetical protein